MRVSCNPERAGGRSDVAIDPLASKYRGDFPILDQKVNGFPLVYLDNAASTQHPACVIDEISRYYREDHANVHRGIHALSSRATKLYEEARTCAAQFLGAASSESIIFTRGTTEGINLVASSWGSAHLGPGDIILITEMEHHANLIPWQMVSTAEPALRSNTFRSKEMKGPSIGLSWSNDSRKTRFGSSPSRISPIHSDASIR